MAECTNVVGAITGGLYVHALSNAGDYMYVPTGSGIDRWSYPGFVQEADWHTVSGGVESVAVDNSDVLYYRRISDGHLWAIEGDLSGLTDIGAIAATQLVYSSNEDVLYGVVAGSVRRITLAGTETNVFDLGTGFLFRPTIQRGGIIWVHANFSTFYRIDPDDAYSEQHVSVFGNWSVPACTKSGVNSDTNYYSEGITTTPLVCTTNFIGWLPAWTSSYHRILVSDGGSGTTVVRQLKCGPKPPLRIRQRSDDLKTGGPRISPQVTSMQRSLRIYGPSSFA